MLKLNKKGFFASLSISGLIVLMLLSPCSVRNSIQSAFGVPQTKVSNVSKTTVNQSKCVSAALTQFQTKHTNYSNVINAGTAFFTAVSAVAEVEGRTPLFLDKNWIPRFQVVPSYILYQNFRAFL